MGSKMHLSLCLSHVHICIHTHTHTHTEFTCHCCGIRISSWHWALLMSHPPQAQPSQMEVSSLGLSESQSCTHLGTSWGCAEGDLHSHMWPCFCPEPKFPRAETLLTASLGSTAQPHLNQAHSCGEMRHQTPNPSNHLLVSHLHARRRHWAAGHWGSCW